MARSREGPATARFYQLAGMVREQAIARIAAKACEQGLRVWLAVGDERQAAYLDDFLWRFPEEGFLAHGVAGRGDEARQPLLIAPAPSDANGATVALMAGGAMLEAPERFDLVVEFVAGHDPVAVAESRNRYRHYRERGCVMEYQVQGPSGRWEKKQ